MKSKSTPSGWKKVEYSKDVCGRMVPISLSLTNHLKRCEKFIKPGAYIPIVFWLDGTSLGSLKTVAGRYRIIYYPDILIETATSSDIELLREIQTFITIPTSETYSSISSTIKPLLIKEFSSLKEGKIQIFLADNKCEQCMSGIGNGCFPCDCCYSARNKFHSYKAQLDSTKRTICNTANRVLEYKEKKDFLKYGDLRIPILTTQDGNKLPGLENMDEEAGTDSLHIVENTNIDVLKQVIFDCRAAINAKTFKLKLEHYI